MRDYKFRSYVEWADFGFGFNKKKPEVIRKTHPAHAVNIETVMKDIQSKVLGVKQPQKQFFSEVQWGDGVGAIKMTITPFGGTKAIFEKLTTDLLGQPLWITKHVHEIKDKYDDRQEETLIVHLLNILSEVDEGGVDAPTADYQDLENLVIRMSSKCRLHSPEWFVFEGIRKVEDTQYIIRFGCRGQGAGRLTQERLYEFVIDVSYHPEEGFLKVIGSDVRTPVSRESWQMRDSEFIFYFSPVQKMEEIINCVASTLATY